MRIVSGMIDDENYKMKEDKKGESHQCKICIEAESTKVLDNEKLLGVSIDVTIHVDICGLISAKIIDGNVHFLTTTTACERYTRAETSESTSE